MSTDGLTRLRALSWGDWVAGQNQMSSALPSAPARCIARSANDFHSRSARTT
jgi:hypothetical protein